MKFQALKAHYALHKNAKIIDHLNAKRVKAFSVSADELYLDYSKTAIDEKGRSLLLEIAKDSGVFEKRDAMFKGSKINEAENRAVLHVALRAAQDTKIEVDGKNVVPDVHKVLDAMRKFTDGVRSGAITGATGKRFTDIVNIGIGGSDLGPAMATQALAPYHDGPRTYFVSNIDGAHIHDVLKGLSPETTLVLIASKTFTTIETMTNAQTALNWLKPIGNTSAHLAAISTAEDKTAEYGIPAERVFGFEDWVGGRYSMWGPIGLSIMLAIGAERFDQFLAGARAMDTHFMKEEGTKNMPLIMGLIGVFHRNICACKTRAVLPYEERLKRLPAYLQQLDMESNGKSVDLGGQSVDYETGPVVWGEPGTNGQHAFYQLIHQGTDVIPCEFMIGREGHEPNLAHQHQLLIANCLAQSQALLVGRSAAEALKITEAKGYEGIEAKRQAAHRIFKGNRPSTTLIYPKLTPHVLGQIVALYEHRIFVEGAIWGINSFDQWGVELGKELALSIEPALRGEAVENLDASTQNLVDQLR